MVPSLPEWFPRHAQHAAPQRQIDPAQHAPGQKELGAERENIYPQVHTREKSGACAALGKALSGYFGLLKIEKRLRGLKEQYVNAYVDQIGRDEGVPETAKDGATDHGFVPWRNGTLM